MSEWVATKTVFRYKEDSLLNEYKYVVAEDLEEAVSLIRRYNKTLWSNRCSEIVSIEALDFAIDEEYVSSREENESE